MGAWEDACEGSWVGSWVRAWVGALVDGWVHVINQQLLVSFLVLARGPCWVGACVQSLESLGNYTQGLT